jgi:hypothetical protein
MQGGRKHAADVTTDSRRIHSVSRILYLEVIWFV